MRQQTFLKNFADTSSYIRRPSPSNRKRISQRFRIKNFTETCYYNSRKIFMLFYILILYTYYNLYFLILTDDSVNDEMAI
jgi:hypothetical protein